MMQKYKYEGGIYNHNVIYKMTTEYVVASTKRHAIVLLERRLKNKYKEISFIKLKESNLTCIESK